MPDYQDNPYGLPPNGILPGLSTDGASPIGRTRFKGGGRHRTPEDNPFLSKMENPGIVGTSGAANGNSTGAAVPSEPQQLATPDVVSATDPAYSMHPILKALSGSSGTLPAGATIPHSWGSPWQQLGPEFRTKNQLQASILSALGYPGLGLDYGIKTQGEAL